MDNESSLIIDNNLLKDRILILENELKDTKEHLKKYTAPSNMKKYYQNHKEEIIKKVKEYKEKNNYKPIIDKEKRKEYAKRAYLNKKEKLKKISEIKENENI
jgi:hypothetical protein